MKGYDGRFQAESGNEQYLDKQIKGFAVAGVKHIPDICNIECFGFPVYQPDGQQNQHGGKSPEYLVFKGCFQFGFSHSECHQGI